MTTRAERPCPVVLIVVDGFGYGPDPVADAIAAAEMPRWRALLGEWPNSRLDASAGAVGLPEGQMGNSEVGHLNIGAGRPVLQDLPRIDAEIADGSFKSNEVCWPPYARPQLPARGSTSWGSSAPAASTRPTAMPWPSPSWRARPASRTSSCTACSMGATPRPALLTASSPTSRDACPRSIPGPASR